MLDSFSFLFFFFFTVFPAKGQHRLLHKTNLEVRQTPSSGGQLGLCAQLGSLTFGVPSLEYPSWLYAVLPWLHMVEVQGKEGLKCREGGTRVGSAVCDFVGETSSTLATLSSAASLKLPFSCLQSASTP